MRCEEGMKMKSKMKDSGKSTSSDILLLVLVLGSLWGFSEVVLSDIIRAQSIPWRAGILTGIGMGIMGIAVGLNRKALPLVGIALITVAAKLLVVPILGCSFLCKANTCAAVFLQGAALSGAVAIVGPRLAGGVLKKAATGFSAALASAAAFYYVGIHLSPCQYLLSFGGIAPFMQAEGIVWAAFSGVLFPLGYKLGSLIEHELPAVKMTRPLAYYLSCSAGIVCCWAAIATSIVIGI
jgi:hypothetical protein